jgi:hypothetical protein
MIYCVVPKPLEDELFSRLTEHYAGEDGVTVIVERREFDRRARRGSAGASGDAAEQRRVVRDRRRARVTGDPLPLAQAL